MHRLAPLALLALAPLAGCDALGLCEDPPERELTGGEPGLEAVVDGNDAFAWVLYDATAEASSGNIFFSPLSISAAFGMVYGGAAGDTATELEQALAVGLPDDDWHGTFGALLGDLDQGKRCTPVEFSIANKVFTKDGFTLLTEYQDLLEQDYDAPVETFADADAAVDQVNDWVSDETNGHIPELLEQLAGNTVMVLANAIYMKADWAEPFEESQTVSEPFTLLDGASVDVDMMHGMVDAQWGEVEGGQVVSLPYQGDELEMVLALPEADVALADFEASFIATGTDHLVATLTPSSVDLSLPKFELRERLDLIPLMKLLGVEDLFSSTEADLSGMTGGTGLYVDTAVHEAWVLVDEEGTEAAAATAVGVIETAAVAGIEVDFDRPFLFQVRDTVTGTVLFMGRVADPR